MHSASARCHLFSKIICSIFLWNRFGTHSMGCRSIFVCLLKRSRRTRTAIIIISGSGASRVHKIRRTEIIHTLGQVKGLVAPVLVFVFCRCRKGKMSLWPMQNRFMGHKSNKCNALHLRTSLQASSVFEACSLKCAGSKVSICCLTFASISSFFLFNCKGQHSKIIYANSTPAQCTLLTVPAICAMHCV